MKRIRAPKSWMMDKMGGVFATRPAQGPHKLGESIPLQFIIQRRLGYALNYRETKVILNTKDNQVEVDGVVRRNHKYPVGLMDVVTIPKTGDKFRVLYDEYRRFTLIKLKDKETKNKLCKVVKVTIGPNKIPYLVTHDARTIRFPDPSIRVGDSIQYNFDTKTIEKVFTLSTGHKVLITAGNNLGRIGAVQSIVKKMGNLAVVTVKDEEGHVFNTRVGNVFVVGDSKIATQVPVNKGIRFTVGEKVEKDIEEGL